MLLGSGCVYRRLTVRTNPPGAIVEVNGKRIGTSPASMDFTYYGTYEIKLSKPGFETLTIKQPVAPPWYQIPPLDAVSDNLIPVQVTNRHDFLWNLNPLPAGTLHRRAFNPRQHSSGSKGPQICAGP